MNLHIKSFKNLKAYINVSIISTKKNIRNNRIDNNYPNPIYFLILKPNIKYLFFGVGMILN
jgi:hypothetical protein